MAAHPTPTDPQALATKDGDTLSLMYARLRPRDTVRPPGAAAEPLSAATAAEVGARRREPPAQPDQQPAAKLVKRDKLADGTGPAPFGMFSPLILCKVVSTCSFSQTPPPVVRKEVNETEASRDRHGALSAGANVGNVGVHPLALGPVEQPQHPLAGQMLHVLEQLFDNMYQNLLKNSQRAFYCHFDAYFESFGPV